MTSILRTITRALRIGKEKHLAGYDLANNAYYELPSRSGSKDPRHTRRTIVWKEKLDFSEYDQSSLPVQWKMWLRHTRRSPPTIQELQQDMQRIRLTQYNASILAAKDEEARNRLSNNQAQQTLSSPSSSQNPDNDVWAASKARIQSQDSKALDSGAHPQPNSIDNESSFANQFGMGLKEKDVGGGDEEINSEFSNALNRRERIRREKILQNEFERKESERRKWLLNKSILEDFDPQNSHNLSLGNVNESNNNDRLDSRSFPSLDKSNDKETIKSEFRTETNRQAEVVEKIGNERGLGNSKNKRDGRPGTPSGEYEPKGWSPSIVKRG